MKRRREQLEYFFKNVALAFVVDREPLFPLQTFGKTRIQERSLMYSLCPFIVSSSVVNLSGSFSSFVFHKAGY